MVSLNELSVNFLGVGAEKAGSTWLADMLRQHPEVYVPPKKEIYFFNEFDPHFLKVKNPKYEWGIGWYLDHFRGVDNASVMGEFSPTYLYSKKTAERIYKHFPEVKIIIILRNPVERAFSQYIQDKRFGLQNEFNLLDAIKTNYTYIEKGLYSKHISNYLKVFSKDRIKIILLDDIRSDSVKVLKDIFSFLDLKDVDFKPKEIKRKSNSARKARFVELNKFMISTEYSLRNSRFKWILKHLEGSGVRETAIKIRDLNSEKYKSYPKLTKKTKKELYKHLREDINDLEKLIDRDLRKWKY